jgi:branched-chain amino acid transport system permease protein
VIIAIALLIPLVYPEPYFLRLAVLTFIYSILAMSLNLLLGFTGIISLGHAAFFGIGAYTTGVLSTTMGMPFLFNLPASAIASAMIAFLYGALVLKSLKFLYFALASWGLGEILIALYMNVGYLGGTVGIRGIPEPTIFGFILSSDIRFYYLTLIFAILTLISLELLILSRIGRAWVAIRENEVVAGVMGIHIYYFQLISLIVSSFYAGMAGSLYAYYETYISPGSFAIWESIVLICMVLVGGRRSLIGSAVGAALLTFLPEVLRQIGEYRMLVYGFILLFTILFKPRGLIPPYYFFEKVREK